MEDIPISFLQSEDVFYLDLLVILEGKMEASSADKYIQACFLSPSLVFPGKTNFYDFISIIF